MVCYEAYGASYLRHVPIRLVLHLCPGERESPGDPRAAPYHRQPISSSVSWGFCYPAPRDVANYRKEVDFRKGSAKNPEV